MSKANGSLVMEVSEGMVMVKVDLEHVEVPLRAALLHGFMQALDMDDLEVLMFLAMGVPTGSSSEVTCETCPKRDTCTEVKKVCQ